MLQKLKKERGQNRIKGKTIEVDEKEKKKEIEILWLNEKHTLAHMETWLCGFLYISEMDLKQIYVLFKFPLFVNIWTCSWVLLASL